MKLVLTVLSFLLAASVAWGQTGNLSGGTVKSTDGTTARTLADRAIDNGFSVLEKGAVCNGSTDDTTAINAALSSGHKRVTIPAGAVCYSATGVTVPANVMLQGMSFAYGYPANAAVSSSVIKCARNVAACVTVSTASSYDAAGIRDLVVMTAATSGSLPTSGDCIKIDEGYNIILDHVAVTQCYVGYYWDSSAGLGISGRMMDTYSGQIADAHIVQDTWPELRISQSRFGSNGALSDYAANAFIREKGGLAANPGVLPNGLFVFDSQFNQSGAAVSHFMEFVSCVSCGTDYWKNGSEWHFTDAHVEGVDNFLYSDSSWLSVNALQVINSTLTLSSTFFALNAATTVIGTKFIGDTIAATTFVLAPPNCIGLTLTEDDLLGVTGAFTLTAPSGCGNATVFGNKIGGNVTLSGGAWDRLDYSGNQRNGTFTNTATGNANIIDDYQYTSYTPVVAAWLSGAITSYTGTGSYQIIAPHRVCVNFNVTITNHGTANSFYVSLPFAPIQRGWLPIDVAAGNMDAGDLVPGAAAAYIENAGTFGAIVPTDGMTAQMDACYRY